MNIAYYIQPSGTYNGVNNIFTLPNIPSSGNVNLNLDGLRLRPKIDYSLSGQTLTIVVPPKSTDILVAFYTYA